LLISAESCRACCSYIPLSDFFAQSAGDNRHGLEFANQITRGGLYLFQELSILDQQLTRTLLLGSRLGGISMPPNA
jgi:hypothetical protein